MSEQTSKFQSPSTKKAWVELANSLNAEIKSTYSIRDIMESICKKLKIRGYNSKSDGEVKSLIAVKIQKNESKKIIVQNNKSEDKISQDEVIDNKPSELGKIETKSIEIDNTALKEAERQHYISECARLGIQIDPAIRIEWLMQELKYHSHKNPEHKYIPFNRAAYLKDAYGITESPQIYSDTTPNENNNVLKNDNPHANLEGEQLLAALRKESDLYGIAYHESHTSEQLENVLRVVRNTVKNKIEPPKEYKTQNPVNTAVPTPTIPEQLSIGQPLNMGENVIEEVQKDEETVMTEYGLSVCDIMNKMFRKMSVNQVRDYLGKNRKLYPFEFSIIETSQNKIQIKLTTSTGLTKTFPSENTELTVA
jgi:hypothetical protein